MASTIKPRRGTTAPTTGLVEGELAIDTTNKRVYVGNVGGSGDLVGSSPGGSDTYIQFNDSGNFGGDVGLTYNKTTDAVTMLGDLNLNGGGIKTTQSSISIIPSTATTVSLGTAATSLTMGGASCTTTVNGGTLVGNLSAQNLFNTTATTLNIGGAATTLTVGGTTGTAAVRNPTLRLGNTTSSITTNSGTTNSITLAPYGSVLITPTTSTSLGGTFASLVVTNSDSAAGQVQITGGDLYLGSKTDAGDVESPCNIIFEGVADASELTLTVDTLSADRIVTLPDAAGTVGVMASPTNQQIQFYDSTSKNLKGDADLTFDGTNLQIGSQGDLRLADSDSSNWVAFQAPATVSSNVTWTLPSADGTSGQVLSTNGSGALSWATAGGGGGTKTYAAFTPLDNQPTATNYATIDTRNSIMVLDFDAATDESAVFVGVMPEAASLASGLKIRIHWMATSATSGTCRWGVQIERMTTDEDSDSFDTAATAGSTTNATSGIITVTEITITTIDSVTAGDAFRLKVYRDADGTSGTDDMTGDAELVVVEVRSAA